MLGDLEEIQGDIDAGRASAQSLVQLYNAAAEAEQRRDVRSLAGARTLAQRLVEVLDDGLGDEARRLVELCTDLLERAAQAASAAEAGVTTCPACGRELAGEPVRCRDCGELLV